MPVINCGNVKVKGSKQAIAALFAHLAPKPPVHSVELVYLETCNSDYFQGFGGHVYAIPAEGKPRVKDIRWGLVRAIFDEELWINGASAPEEDYESLQEQVLQMFKAAHPLRSWAPSRQAYGEDCYAYFGVKVIEEVV